MNEIDDIIANKMGYYESNKNTFSYETNIPTDDIFKELVSSQEDLYNLNMKIELDDNLTSQKINMLKKLKRCYCDGRMKNVNAKASLESYLDHSTEILGSAIAALFSLCISIVVKLIKFVIKTVLWISKTVTHAVSSMIASLSKTKKPDKKKVDGFMTKFFKHCEAKMRGLASLDRGTESDPNTQQMDKDSLRSLAQYCSNYIVDAQTARNMSPEELLFYKIFLIDGNPKDIKYVYESFNRSTTGLKEYGSKLSRAGSKLIIDTRPTANTNKSSEKLENYSIEDSREQDLERLGNILVKSNIVDIRKHDPARDLKLMITGLHHSLLSSEDILWMKKFYNTFNNGLSELKIISRDLQTNKKQLEKINKDNLSNDNKRNIELYNNDVNEFQKFLVSYNKCIQYFLKYYKIRTDIIRRFSYMIETYDYNVA